MTSKSNPSVSARFRLRLSVGAVVAVGPGKIALLEAIREHHSISAAAKALGMSYKRAWDLVNELNECLKQPAVTSSTGGISGGGTALTDTGELLIHLYRTVESKAGDACRTELNKMSQLMSVQTPSALRD